MLDLETVLYCFIGMFTGFLSGLLGIAGGIIIVPSLLLIMPLFNSDLKDLMQIILPTSLASMIFCSLTSMLFHQKEKAIEWDMIWKMILGLLLGSCIGVAVTRLFPSHLLVFFFSFFLFYSAYHFIKAEKPPSLQLTKPSFIACSFAGSIISSLATILGTGGASFSIRFFTRYFDFRKAIGNAAALGFFITLISTILHFFVFVDHKAFSTLYLKALVPLTIFSVLFAPLGVKSVHRLKISSLRRIFGFFLVFLACTLLIKIFI